MSLTLEDLIAKHAEKSKRPTCENRLRNREYRNHYPLVKESVLAGVPLWSVVDILQKEDAALAAKTRDAVWQAFRRALEKEGIILSKIEK